MSGTVLPILRQWYYTPLRDVFRAQLTGRLDWRSTLCRSGLPQNVQSAILEVVCSSGLMRSEKVAVCDELIAHFEDGQRAGHSFENLLNDFGDLRIAANLIGRGKRRTRSMFMKIGRVAGYFGLGAIASYIAITIYFWLGQANPHIDFLVDLNKVAINEKDESKKAWPIYRETWIKYDVLNSQKNQRLRDIYALRENGNIDSGQLLKPGDAEWPKAVAFLNEYREMLDAYRAAGKKPLLGFALKKSYAEYEPRDLMAIFPYKVDESGMLKEEFRDTGIGSTSAALNEVMNGSVVGVLLPHIQEFRNIANLLIVDTRRAVEENDTGRALENIKTIFAMSQHASESPILVCGLVGLAVDDLGFDLIEETVNGNIDFFLSNEQLAELQSIVAKLPIREQIQFDGERAMMYDMLQRLYTDDGNGDGRLTATGAMAMNQMYGFFSSNPGSEVPTGLEIIYDKVTSPASVFTVASRKEMKQKYDELIAAAEQSFDQPVASQQSVADRLKELDTEHRYRLIGLVMPAIDQVRRAMDVRLARRDAVELALAATRFRKSNGKLPSKVAELVPDFIETLPTDPLTGRPLNLASSGGELKIYSVGNDLKDDGGQPLTDSKSKEAVNSSRFQFQAADSQLLNGDWILWPYSK